MSILRIFLSLVAGSLERRRFHSRRQRAERDLRQRCLYLVVDVELGRVVLEGEGVGAAVLTLSSLPHATQLAGRLFMKTNRVHVVSQIVKAVPLELFEALAFGPESSP